MKAVQKSRPTLGLAMIMKDEIDDLDRIVADYSQYFDKIYVTVTDKKTYLELTKAAKYTSKVKLSYFKWIDHFGKARRYNQAQIKTDYWLWIDLDDEIEGVEKLRDIIEYMVAKELDAVAFQYERTSRASLAEPAPIQWRERIIRTTSSLEWNDKAVHENISIEGDTDMLFQDVVIKHRKTAEQIFISSARNRIILEKEWQQASDVETAQYLGATLMDAEEYESAIEKILFVTQHGEDKAERFRAWQRLSECYVRVHQYSEALQAADECIAIEPDHPWPWYQKFSVCMATGDYNSAIQSAEIALTKRLDGELAILLVNDQSLYQYRGPFSVAQAYLSLGNTERAYQLYSEVKRIAPQYINEVSVMTEVQWSAVFEQAHDEPERDSRVLLTDKRLQELQSLVHEASLAGKPFEGMADSAELNYLTSLAALPNIKRVAEIGFNGGTSSYAFLFANPETTVISFDLGEYDYVQTAKDIIDEEFPKRHKLVIGDSTKTIPDYHKAHPQLKFDLIFIDGGHDYETAKADIENMKKFADKDTILVIDDLTPWLPWGVGPARAWTEAIQDSLVVQDEIVKDGVVVDVIVPPGARVWARGKYVNP